MPPNLVAGCWLLAFEASAALAQAPLSPQPPNPSGQSSIQALPANPFPRANSVWLQTTGPWPAAMDRLVRYCQAQGYVVDTVDREGFFTMQAHTTLPLPQRPVRLHVRASFGGLLGTVRLRATYERVMANGQVPPQRVHPIPVYYQPAILPAPARQRQVRYTTFLAPARRAAFLELQRVSRGAFPEATLTYGNEVP